jgi:hypothetical protein
MMLCMHTRSILPILLLWAAGAAQATLELELRRCGGIAEAASRLACFDALAADANRRPAPTTNAANSSLAASASGFGIRADEPDSIVSTIPGRFEGWQPTTRFRLANGQVWMVADGSAGAYWLDNPKVTIVKGSLGAFYLRVDGTSISVRVRRQP